MPIVYSKYANIGPIKGQPYLRPAFQAGRKLLVERIRKVIAGKKGPLKNAQTIISKLDRAGWEAALVTAQIAKRLAPVRTGNLKRSIFARQIKEFEYTVGTNVVYAAAVEFGLPARKVVPVRKTVLRFEVKRSRGKKRKAKKKRRRGRRR